MKIFRRTTDAELERTDRERESDRTTAGFLVFGSLWWSPLGVLYVNIKVDNSTMLCGKSPKKERETFIKLSRL